MCTTFLFVISISPGESVWIKTFPTHMPNLLPHFHPNPHLYNNPFSTENITDKVSSYFAIAVLKQKAQYGGENLELHGVLILKFNLHLCVCS